LTIILLECIFKDEIIKEYFFDNENKEFVKCSDGCENCVSKNICSTCDFSSGYYGLKDIEKGLIFLFSQFFN